MDPVRAITLSGACIFILGAFLRYTTLDSAYDLLMIIPIALIGGAYALAPQLRWWYWKTHAPDLPGGLAPLLERFDLYRRLDLAGKREFRRRTFLLKERFHFHGEAIEEIPEDVRVMVAASATTAGFHREDFLLGDFETVVFYRHVFPSPQFDLLHCSELHVPDGAIIWTLNIFLRSVVEPKKYLQLGLYEYYRAVLVLEPDLRRQVDTLALTYEDVARLSGFTEAKLKEFIGLPQLDRAAITLTLYQTHREELRRLQPELLAKLDKALPIPTNKSADAIEI